MLKEAHPIKHIDMLSKQIHGCEQRANPGDIIYSQGQEEAHGSRIKREKRGISQQYSRMAGSQQGTCPKATLAAKYMD
jgi:hypothetical protein